MIGRNPSIMASRQMKRDLEVGGGEKEGREGRGGEGERG